MTVYQFTHLEKRKYHFTCLDTTSIAVGDVAVMGNKDVFLVLDLKYFAKNAQYICSVLKNNARIKNRVNIFKPPNADCLHIFYDYDS